MKNPRISLAFTGVIEAGTERSGQRILAMENHGRKINLQAATGPGLVKRSPQAAYPRASGGRSIHLGDGAL